MSITSESHVIRELLHRNIKGDCGVKKAQKSLFAWNFKCRGEDEYSTVIQQDSPDPSQQVTEPPIYSCKFGKGHNYGHVLVLANEDGLIGLRDTRKSGTSLAVEGHQIHQSAIFDVCWVPGSGELVSVAGDLRVAVVAVREDGRLDTVQSLLGHTRSIKTVHVNPADPYVLATGARDGNIIIWDKRCKPHHKADEIAPAHYSHGASRSTASPSVRRAPAARVVGPVTNNSVTGVLFQHQHTLISAGSSDGLIKLWDLRKTHSGGRREPQCQNVLEYSGKSSHHGFTSLTLSPTKDILYTSCMDDIIYAYHLVNPTPKPVAEYLGHVALTYFVKSCLSPCGSYLLSGSSDNSAYIWLTDSPGQPVAKLTGHFAEVTAVDWCPIDNEKLVTCADDMKVRIFQQCNTNLDDFDVKLNIRGVSEQYTKADREDTHTSPLSTRERVTSESHEPLPMLPVTPSTSRVRAHHAATPSGSKRESLNDTPQSCPSTPHQHTTPRHKHLGRGRSTPCTPKTSERNTLLQWLATAKTPGPRDTSGTTEVSVSDSKKESLKRKLTDLMGEVDQENEASELKPKSPTGTSASKNVLCTSTVMNSSTPPFSVAKMLKYGDDLDPKVSSNQDKNDAMVDESDSVKPIEAQDNASFSTGFRKPVTNSISRSLENGGKLLGEDKVIASSPKHRPFLFGHLSSPTANLPNYIVDGASPHKRPEIKVEKKRNLDWLTSFSHQTKLKKVQITKCKNIIKIKAKSQID